MRELMVDIETLSVKPYALVLSIGAVVFDTFEENETGDLGYQIIDRFVRKPDVIEQILLERDINEHTVRWWKKQSAEAKLEAFDRVRQNVHLCFSGLAELWQRHELNKVWAKPPSFDCVILEELAEAAGTAVPWSHRNRYDLRTLVNEASYSEKGHDYSNVRAGALHDAVIDCERQIDLLTACRNKIKRRVG
jgi:hypothetical protein